MMVPRLIRTVLAWPGTYWILLLILVSALNIQGRVAVERSLGWSTDEQVRFPEKVWTYDADGLRAFVRAAGGAEGEALGIYVGRVLTGTDIAFAIGLAATTAYLWYWIATVQPAPGLPARLQALLRSTRRWRIWLAVPLGALAIVYGVSDVAEDLTLARLLRDPDRIDPAAAATANLLTRIKMASLGGSVVGYALFLPIGMAHDLVVREERRRAKEATPAA